MTRLLSIRFSNLWKRFDFLYSTFGYKEKQQHDKNIEIMHEFSRRVIVQRRELLTNKENLKLKDEEDTIGLKRKMAFLDVLLQSKINDKPLSDDEILEEVTTFMFAVCF